MERFWSKVLIENPYSCWLWRAGKQSDGYGIFQLRRRKPALAHRVAYKLWFGTVPDGFELDHLCRRRDCVNPYHLESVTHYENMRRGDVWKTLNANAIKTHCPKGHEYNTANTRVYRGLRYCRECDRLRAIIRRSRIN